MGFFESITYVLITEIYFPTLRQDTASSGHDGWCEILAMLFYLVLRQCWDAEPLCTSRSFSTSPYPDRSHSGEGILHTAFSKRKGQTVKTPKYSLFLLPVPFQKTATHT